MQLIYKINLQQTLRHASLRYVITRHNITSLHKVNSLRYVMITLHGRGFAKFDNAPHAQGVLLFNIANMKTVEPALNGH